MLDTMARQGGFSDYAHVAVLDPATGTPPGRGGDPRPPGTLCRAGSGAPIADYHATWPNCCEASGRAGPGRGSVCPGPSP